MGYAPAHADSEHQGILARVNRRLRTIALGAIPVIALTGLISVDRIPGTSVSMTVPYAAEGPGPSFDTLSQVNGQDVVSISGAPVDKTEGTLNMTTVSVRHNLTLAQAMSRWLTTDDTLVPIEQIFPPNLTEGEVDEQNLQAFSASESAATLAAMRHLGKPVEVEIAGTQPQSPAEEEFKPGDRIVSVEGARVTEPGQASDEVRKHKPGDTITVGVKRDGKQKDIRAQLAENPKEKGVPMLGVLMKSVPAGKLEVDYHLEDIGGPSAGLMFSMAVVDKLSDGHLNGGKKVFGTGTIEDDGSVGPVGGVVHKVQSAADMGAEVFLSPVENCSEAIARKHDGLTVISVDSLDDAIKQLDAYNRGEHYDTCK